MASIDIKIPEDVYKNWLEERMVKIENMTIEEIEARIIELAKINFFYREESRLIFEAKDKKTGRKGLAAFVKDRDKLITDPNIKVDWSGDPRKNYKKSKEEKTADAVNAALGIDLSELKKSVVEARKNKIVPTEVNENKPEEKPKTDASDLKARLAAKKAALENSNVN